jgi:DNA-directed RNA polymerase subunit RPC12/RpoP
MAGMPEEPLDCPNCGRRVPPDDAIRRATVGGLDPSKWQTLCCPNCGARVKTVFVSLE